MDKSVREAVLNALLLDQHHVCAYCMCRIEAENAKIEHLMPQSTHPELALEFKNMAAVCSGSLFACGKNGHCDKSKANKTIKLNPYGNKFLEVSIRYVGGQMLSHKNEWQHDIEEILHLNCGRLPELRKSVLNGFINSLRKRKANTDWTPEFIYKKFHELDNQLKWPEFWGIVRWYVLKSQQKHH